MNLKTMNKPKVRDIDNDVCVAAFDKHTGFIGPTTSCLLKDAQKYAKYYRSIGYNSRVITFDELEEIMLEERKTMCGY